MARPRIDGLDQRIIASFIDRGIFATQKEVISAGLRALVREQKAQEALARGGNPPYEDSTYLEQLNTTVEPENASMGHLDRQSTARAKRA